MLLAFVVQIIIVRTSQQCYFLKLYPKKKKIKKWVFHFFFLHAQCKNHCLRASWHDFSRALKNTFPGNPINNDKRGEHHINGDRPPVWQEVLDLVDVVHKHYLVVHVRRVHHRCEERLHTIVSLDSVNDSLQYLSNRILRNFLYLVDVAHRNLPQQVNT